jgi:hypothetical protein
MDPVLAWPPPPLTAEQIEEARTCDTGLAPTDAGTACDLARQANACMMPADSAVPVECTELFRQAVAKNPLLAVMGPLPAIFFGETDLVAPMVPADARVVRLHVVYGWTGLGRSVAWTLDITDGEKLKVKSHGARFRTPDDLEGLLAALPAALGDFLPVPHGVRAID